jgi:hypothetical protein
MLSVAQKGATGLAPTSTVTVEHKTPVPASKEHGPRSGRRHSFCLGALNRPVAQSYVRIPRGTDITGPPDGNRSCCADCMLIPMYINITGPLLIEGAAAFLVLILQDAWQ